MLWIIKIVRIIHGIKRVHCPIITVQMFNVMIGNVNNPVLAIDDRSSLKMLSNKFVNFLFTVKLKMKELKKV